VEIGAEETEPLIGEAFGRWMRNEAQRTRETAALAGMKDE
jgi:hypothetical protein